LRENFRRLRFYTASVRSRHYRPVENARFSPHGPGLEPFAPNCGYAGPAGGFAASSRIGVRSRSAASTPSARASRSTARTLGLRVPRSKGNAIPYVAHLLAATATVLEWGGDEDTAMAALLHDAVEDQGGEATADLIRARCGDRVADLVLHCTDSASADPDAKRPWLARKTAYLDRLAHADAGAALVTAADKLHNITAIVRDVRACGPQTLQRFAEPTRLVWYYRAVAAALEPHRNSSRCASWTPGSPSSRASSGRPHEPDRPPWSAALTLRTRPHPMARALGLVLDFGMTPEDFAESRRTRAGSSTRPETAGSAGAPIWHTRQ